MTIEEMLAREAIRYTVSIYNRAIDEGRYDELRRVFLPQAVLRLVGGGTFEGVEAIVAALKAGAAKREANAPGNFQRHHLGAAMIEMDGPDRAIGRHYITVITELGLDHAGSYNDVYRRQNDRWLVAERVAQIEWADDRSRFMRWLENVTPGT